MTFSTIQIKFERILNKLGNVINNILAEIAQVQEKKNYHKMSMTARCEFQHLENNKHDKDIDIYLVEPLIIM